MEGLLDFSFDIYGLFIKNFDSFPVDLVISLRLVFPYVSASPFYRYNYLYILFLSNDVILMTSSVNVGKRKSNGIFGIFGVTM